MNKKIFEYTFLKSELTAEIVLIVHIENEWLDKELDISLNKDSLEIKVGETVYNSEKLPIVLLDWLNKNQTKVFFANDEGNVVSEAIIGDF